jgi:uncharacterized protein YegP (UPF0339 family)
LRRGSIVLRIDVMNAQPQQQKRTIVAAMQFRIKERADGTWQWQLFDEHGNLLANCVKTYPGKGAVLDAIEQVRKAAGAIVLES